jgi:hypothetical protein
MNIKFEIEVERDGYQATAAQDRLNAIVKEFKRYSFYKIVKANATFERRVTTTETVIVEAE